MMISREPRSDAPCTTAREPNGLPQRSLYPARVAASPISATILPLSQRKPAMVRLLAFIGFLAIIAAVAGAVFFLGGFYSVAATGEDTGVIQKATDWAIGQTR